MIEAVIVSFFQEAVARLEEIKKSIESKIALRQSNLNPERPGESGNHNALFSLYVTIDVSSTILFGDYVCVRSNALL